jgi:putative holliday junction resolvase
MRILGIDYGLKKIGLAFAESDAGLAVPLEVIRNEGEQTIKDIIQNIESEDIETVVVGVPLKTGSHHNSDQLDLTRAFIERLKASTDLPVVEVDESYTTAESIRLQKEEGSDAPEDALAAMLILRGYLDETIDKQNEEEVQ